MNRLSCALLWVGAAALSACGGADQESKGQELASPQEPAAAEAEIAEAPAADTVALTFLKAYRDKDLATLRECSVPVMAINFTESNTNLDRCFQEDVIEELKTWDGKIKETRYGKDKWTGLEVAVVHFADRPRSGDDDVLLTLTLDRIEGRWLFGVHDFTELTRQEFDEYVPKTP